MIIIFRGGCSNFPPKERSGGHRLLIIPNEINEKGLSNTKLRGEYESIEKYDMMGKDIGGNYYRFIARSEYIHPGHKEGCNPLLRVQFFATEKNKEQKIGYDNDCKYLNNLNSVLYKQNKFSYNRSRAIENNWFHYI